MLRIKQSGFLVVANLECGKPQSQSQAINYHYQLFVATQFF
jgi:hypothetical protein